MPAQSSNDLTNDFVRLFLQAEPRVYGYIRSQVYQRADAEDILQETAAVLWSKYQDFAPGTDFVAWACQVARFKIQHYHRTKARNRVVFTKEFLDIVADTAEALSSELGEVESVLEGCMEKLKETDRQIVQRCYGTDATISMIAADLQRPVGTVKDILARARRSLYDCIRRSMSKDGRP